MKKKKKRTKAWKIHNDILCKKISEFKQILFINVKQFGCLAFKYSLNFFHSN